MRQPNDTDLHGDMKRLHLEMEGADASEQQRLRPEGVPAARIQDCIAWMAAIWGQPSLHEAAAAGFKKVGLANALDGTEDHLICREARRFWEELGREVARRDAIHDVDVEFEAGRLDWSYDSVLEVVAPFPSRGRRLDRLPSDEGSEEDSSDDSESSSSDDDDDEDSRGGGGDGGGHGVSVADDAPADAGISEGGKAPVVTGYSVALLDRAEEAVVADHAFRIGTLSAVLEQLQSMNCESLIVQVQQALHSEERRARGRSQTNPNVTKATLLEREMELADYARRGAREAAASKQNERRSKTINKRLCTCDAWSFNVHPRLWSVWRPSEASGLQISGKDIQQEDQESTSGTE